MKVIVLAGGFGTRISEEAQADDRDWWKADIVAYHENIFALRDK